MMNCCVISVSLRFRAWFPNAEQIGYRAAEQLSLLMQGQVAQGNLALTEPLDVKVRQSTDVYATQSGFEHPEYLHVVFKREIGMTPGGYRKASQK